jgi:hypothetical protein
VPEQADEAVAGYYVLLGAFILALGLAPVANRIRREQGTRWLILASFLFLSFGVGNPIEDSIYSSTQGITLMIPILLLPCLLFAGALTVLFRPSKEELVPAPISTFLKGQPFSEWAWRIPAAIGAFPMVYFFFGLIVSPIVVGFYRQGVGDLVLPDVGVIFAVQLLRSSLFLLAVVPVMQAWSGSRSQLAVLLGLAFFVLAATFEITLAYELPLVLRITHSIEILADSFVYAWLLVALLVQKE